VDPIVCMNMFVSVGLILSFVECYLFALIVYGI
jgi:hypothetical protein